MRLSVYIMYLLLSIIFNPLNQGFAQSKSILGKLFFEEDKQAISNVEIYIYGVSSLRTHTDDFGLFSLNIPNYLLDRDSIRIVIRFDDIHQPTGYLHLNADTALVALPYLPNLDYSQIIKKQENATNISDEINNKDSNTNKSSGILTDTTQSNQKNIINSTVPNTIQLQLNGKSHIYDTRSLNAGLALYNYTLDELTEIFQGLEESFIKNYQKWIQEIKSIQEELETAFVLSPGKINSLRNRLSLLEKKVQELGSNINKQNTNNKILIQKAQQEINRLQNLLREGSRFVLLHKLVYYGMLTAIFLFLFLILIFIYLFWQLYQRKKLLSQQIETISQQNQEIKVINEELATQRDQLNELGQKLQLSIYDGNHRVKNFLQRTSNLLDLSMRKGENMEEILNNIRRRIHSMSFVYQKLQDSGNMDQVNLNDYVQNLVSYISDIYLPEDQQIKYQVIIPNLMMNVSKATDIGLIINELTTNAFKYAFRGLSEGKVEITITSLDNNQHQLIIKDNGVGFPEDLYLAQTKTLGLKLARRLVKRLGSNLELKNTHPGTTFIAVFQTEP